MEGREKEGKTASSKASSMLEVSGDDSSKIKSWEENKRRFSFRLQVDTSLK